MSSVRRLVGAVAVVLLAVLGVLVLSQPASALLREDAGSRVVTQAKLAEEAPAPKNAPGLCWARARIAEVPERRPELTAVLTDEAPSPGPAARPARAPEAPYWARRQPRAAVLQVFRC
ncbi:hypothetical protein CFP65_7186 [Kitasatospora sp. MMS16-BH015]|uniref:hypothetical protein n=1 Tax=Kitasatospora sp. MMS16-BH015 TaxID=2018025 RepID=UPI000CA261D1|nr:hypothetical protein [Kitasatospora sp. MMS16-BH015]AUG81781.1 hypothetical protein CFP65_7186 [Kitasatospora sp. MMS16-BH015]